MMGHKDIDDILQDRFAPPPASNLSQRIITAAQVGEASAKNRKWRHALDEVLSMFILPRPAYAFAASIVIGLIIGLQAGGVLDMYQQDLTTFLYVDEGDWL